MRSAFLILPLLLATIASAKPTIEIVGNVRVQVISPTLVRFEMKGKEGFEDRPTFHVIDRTGPGAPLVRSESNGEVRLQGPGWRIELPASTTDLNDVQILDNNGQSLFKNDGKLDNKAWLPSPASVPPSWAVADTPRVIPSKRGLVPDDPMSPTSGWDVSNDAPDIYVFLPGGSYSRLRKDFLKLTGPIEMPPLFALGYIDSRYFIYHEADALARIDEYRQRKIPLDMFVVDTDWRLGGSHGYTPDPQYFPDMPRFLKAAHEKNVKIMFNDHPEPASKEALDPKELQRRYDGLGGLLNEGVDVWWYDRNWFVGLVPPAPNLAKEVWGMKLYRDITQAVRPNQRPLIMANVDGIDNGIRNRPPNIAAHRYPVQWTGDTSSHWAFLQRGVANAVDEGVEGLNAWVNEDLGGHIGKPTPDLYIRYLQYGSVAPVMRVHSTRGQTREPWAFGPDAERIVPEYIKMRYRLLPLLYNSAHEATTTGLPQVRRLDLYYPQYKEARRNDQFLLGDSILVAPIIVGDEDKPLPASLFRTPDGRPGLKGEYFANQELNGDPALVRTDPSLDFNWGMGSPDKSIPVDHFSARWTGRIGPIPGIKPYKLLVTADDGVRVWVDGKLEVDEWKDQDSVGTPVGALLAPGSTHDIKVEYFENSGNAVCRLTALVKTDTTQSVRDAWIPPGSWKNLWTGEVVEGPRTVEVAATLAQMPMFVQEGSIIPLAPEMQYTEQRPWDTVTLDVYPALTPGSADLYEDDGISNDYRKGLSRETSLAVRPIVTTRLIVDLGQPRRIQLLGGAEVSVDGSAGSFRPGDQRSWAIRVHLPAGRSVSTVLLDGKPEANWKVVRAGASATTPFQNFGPSLDGDVAEILIPKSSISRAHKVQVTFGRR